MVNHLVNHQFLGNPGHKKGKYKDYTCESTIEIITNESQGKYQDVINLPEEQILRLHLLNITMGCWQMFSTRRNN